MRIFGKKKKDALLSSEEATNRQLEEMRATMAKMNEQMQVQNLQMKTLMEKQNLIKVATMSTCLEMEALLPLEHG